MLDSVKYCQLVAKEKDFGNYIIYVFKILEDDAPFGKRFCMCTRWPNWEHRDIELFEKGYLHTRDVVAAKDTWYDSVTQKTVPYNYTNTIFIRFVKQEDNISKDIIL